MNEINGKETYTALAAALPWELRTTLLDLRDAEEEGDYKRIEKVYTDMPSSVYYALFELCLVEDKDETKRAGVSLRLTRAGKHLADYCTC